MDHSASASLARILIVDDEPTNIGALAEAFADLPDYELSFATDGIRALELAVSQPFDLILLDVIMPRMSGFEVLRWLKSESRTQHIAVIFVTSLDDAVEEEHGLNLGAVDYLVKPIHPAIVRARVRTHLELKRQRDLLEQHAMLDGLTGIANRRRFDTELARAWGVAQRGGNALMLMLIDIDHFKGYNETYGHNPGDHCLRAIAQALAQTFVRAGDLVARYGGEKFALLTGPEGDSVQILKALEAVRALKIAHTGSESDSFVSVSVGAVNINPTADLSAEDFVVMVDEMLYAAKHAGRNRGEFTDLVHAKRSSVISIEEPSSDS